MTTVCSPPPPFRHCGFEYCLPGTCDVSGLTLIHPEIVSCCPDWNPLVGAGGDDSLFTPPSGDMVLSIVFLAFVMLPISPSPSCLLISTHLQEGVIVGCRAEDAELTVVAGDKASISQIGEFPVLTTFVGVFTIEGKKPVQPSLRICWSDFF